MPSDRFVDVTDRDVLALEAAGHDRAAVDHEAGDVHARERHDRAWDGLVAAADANERVEEMPACDQLDGVSDHLARDERCLHTLGAHRDPVAHGDRVELDRGATRFANAFLDPLRELPVVEVARHDLDPRMRDPNEWPAEVFVVVADRSHHRARTGASGTIYERLAACTGFRHYVKRSRATVSTFRGEHRLLTAIAHTRFGQTSARSNA